MIMLILRDRPKSGGAVIPVSVDRIARGWRFNTRAVGGFYSAGFTISREDVSRQELLSFFEAWLGREVVDKAFGMTAWEGLIYRMSLILDGEEYLTTLEPDWWHNQVDVYYSTAAVVDTDQGALSYTDESGAETFTDAGQDFGDWDTPSGDCVYRIQVVNSDETTSWAYLGATVSATEVYVYQDVAQTTAGWNDTDPTAKTPSSYQVIQVSLEGQRESTGVTDDAVSQAEYGRMEYIVSLAGASSTAAGTLRDRHLAEFGWPRARFAGAGNTRDGLVVDCVGYWATLFWRYRRSSVTGAASSLIAGLVGDSEFVTAGTIESNPLEVTADAYPVPQRLGDLVTRVTEQGDSSGNVWQCGVYAERELDYGAAPTTARYYARNGELLDYANCPVIPQLFRPGVLVQSVTLGSRYTPPGAGARARAGVTYVDQVEWERERGALRLSLVGQPSMAAVLQTQIFSGTQVEFVSPAQVGRKA